jgi:ABC-2 type transport system permease protein
LAVAVFVLVAAPLTVLYLGGLLAGLPAGAETKKFLAAIAGTFLLAALLAGVSALISAVTTRRGLAVAAVIVVLVLSYSVVAAVQGIAMEEGLRRLAELVGLLSPYSLVDGAQVWLFGTEASTQAPPTGQTGLLYLVTALAVTAACVIGMLARYRKATAI